MSLQAIRTSLRLSTSATSTPAPRSYSRLRRPVISAIRRSTFSRPFSSSSKRVLTQPVIPNSSNKTLHAVKQRWRPFRNGEWDARSKIFAGAVSAAIIYYIVHLEKIQESGRWRFIDISVEAEKQIANRTTESVMQKYGDQILPADHPITLEVVRVASRIITAANLGEVKNAPPPQSEQVGAGILNAAYATWGKTGISSEGQKRLRQEWEVFVIRDDSTPNAFVTGGGKIFVFTGIMPLMKNDDGLATVLGHEIAHQALRHISESASDLKVMGALVMFLELLGLDVGLTRVGLTFLMLLPNSRKHETEADSIGLRLMAQACFDPRESVGFWERMNDFEEETDAHIKAKSWFNMPSFGDFLHTHPATPKRIAAMQQLIPAALQVRAGSVCSLADGHYLGDHYRKFKKEAMKELEYV